MVLNWRVFSFKPMYLIPMFSAQCEPGEYKNLVVRVWGFSAYFVEERAGRDIASSLKFTQDGDKCSIAYRHESLELDGESLTVLVFGTHEET